jgi:hypothetical protein
MGVLRGVATQPGTAVSVGGASTQVSSGVKSSAGGRYFANDHATQVVYLTLGPGPAVLNSGIRLNAAGGSIIIENYSGPVFAIATGAATPVLVAEV